MKHVRFREWDCIVQKRKYGNGGVALQLVDGEDGSPIATATVNIPGLKLGHNEVAVKDYSENEGLLGALVEAGVVKPTGRVAKTGHVEVPVCELLPPYQEITLPSGRVR
jgi:hypothetical protein